MLDLQAGEGKGPHPEVWPYPALHTGDQGVEVNETAVRLALRRLISYLDYDLHKSIECDEETGDDNYPLYAEGFIRYYNQNKERFGG